MLIILTTTPNKSSAEKIAKHLIKTKQAACVNIIKIENSIYRWKNKIKQSPEFLLIIKTKKPLYKRLETELAKIHPYKVPEIACLKVKKANEKYLDWLNSACL
ncbi:divalent-cation tolerance protein CutA [Candidatus Micrarchaeota archaeon]|nr:divalent-cation tolerance protein CutA [Candidatus Micrarchaeota archaeon]